MPRLQTTPGTSSSSGSQTASHLLKRNQACHQCRRRKLKCDTRRPCTTCVKSHRFAATSNVSLLDQEPECTYDELLLDGTPAVKPRTKYKALEDRISELEAMLKMQETKQPEPTHGILLDSGSTSLPSDSSLSASLPDLSQDGFTLFVSTNQPPSVHSHPNPPPQLPGYAPFASEQQLMMPDWPPQLPLPDLLHHLVEVFFGCYPHARHLLHQPTFMTSLSFSPRSSKFPHISVLHAICAYAGMYSYLVDSPPMPDLEKARGDVIFGDRRHVAQVAAESFADRHARLAKETRDEATALGFNLLECTQSVVISTGYYYLQGRWVELWMAGGSVLRYCVPLTLNSRVGYHTTGIVTDDIDEASLLFRPVDCIEQEQRVHLFWIAYANDRFQTTPGAWAMGIDDEDVHQVLPCELTYYETGQDIREPRQTLRTPNVLLVHPQSADSFTLYVKAAILISKVKTLCLRLRHQHPDVSDIRELPQFQQLDQQIASFRKSFPLKYSDPVTQSSRGLDIHLYVAHIIPSFAMITLHEKLIDMSSPNCLSKQRILEAIRESIDLVYAACSTSFDTTRLLPICFQCWYKAASLMVQVAKIRMAMGRYEDAATADSEVKNIQLALSCVAHRIPLALRFMKMLEDEIKDDGKNHSQSVQSAMAYGITYEPHLASSRSLQSGAQCGPVWSTTLQLNPIIETSRAPSYPGIVLPSSDLTSVLHQESESLFQFESSFD